MTIAAIREKLHDYINIADDKKVEAIYIMVEDELAEKTGPGEVIIKKANVMKQAASDPLFLADLREIQDDFAHLDNANI